MYVTDVVVIGAGPAGLFSIFECGMQKLSCHVIDALDHVGGQCRALYPEKPIYDIPAYPAILAGDLVDKLYEQAAPFKPTYHLNQRVTHILQDDEKYWIVRTSKDVQIKTKAIIIAAGAGAFGPNRPPLENIEDYEGTSIFYFVKSREDFRDKSILIAGGGDSAVDWAISLSELAKSVSIVHRRPKFKAAPESLERLTKLSQEGEINLIVPYQLSGLKGENGFLTHVIIDSLDGTKQEIEADILLPFFGLSMNLGPISEWGLGLEHNHITVDPLTAKTNREGIFAIGDVATYAHKQKLILTGFAEAAQAAQAIRAYTCPDEILHFEYSTTKGVGIHTK
ncbi:MAG TPA: NAD(P)/FAD-dependent oxidoreductase [Alphaproteobacteria bacterium]|nr:NAD(P)/FAD-dependent oxidoreductase [Alphaproteobacteria bacterium]